MNNTLEYKGYFGTVEYSPEDNILFGKVLGLRSLVSYEGSSVDELRADMMEAVDDYLELCNKQGIAPEKNYKGCLNVRLSPETHRKAALLATANNMSLNQFIEMSISDKINSYNIPL